MPVVGKFEFQLTGSEVAPRGGGLGQRQEVLLGVASFVIDLGLRHEGL